MNVFLTEERYTFLIEGCHQMSLNSLWINLQGDYPHFNDRLEPFFWMLTRALNENRLKLKKNGAYLNGTPEEQVALFRQGFPASEIPDPRYPDIDASYWFYGEECPGEAVWQVNKPDGTVEWMHCP